MSERPAHSPLGASGAERWMRCPGSVRLLQNLQLPETDEPEYRKEGTAAHAALELCLREGLDAWEVQGRHFGADVECTAEMANAIQVFLDAVDRNAPLQWIEEHVDNPEFHPQFYGTIDFGTLSSEDAPVQDVLMLTINDFKYGMGVVVECYRNPQIMYYALGLLLKLKAQGTTPDRVRLRIIQPRAFHPEGFVREWECSPAQIFDWANDELRPAMQRTGTDPALWPGDHCRFCPAKLVCPAIRGMVEAAMNANVEDVVKWDDVLADQTYPLLAPLKSFIKAVEEDVMRRLSSGRDFVHAKLVHKKTNRVFKGGVKEVLLARGIPETDIMTKPEMKSPAEIEKLGAVAKAIVLEYAYTPESGLTVALASDKRVGVKAPLASEIFKEYTGE